MCGKKRERDYMYVCVRARMFVCVCACMCMRACVCACVRACTRACVCVCINISTCTHVLVFKYTCFYSSACICIWRLHATFLLVQSHAAHRSMLKSSAVDEPPPAEAAASGSPQHSAERVDSSASPPSNETLRALQNTAPQN